MCVSGDKKEKEATAWLGEWMVLIRKTPSITQRLSIYQEDFTEGPDHRNVLFEHKEDDSFEMKRITLYCFPDNITALYKSYQPMLSTFMVREGPFGNH